jgi:exonuclease VII small subunit
VSEESAVIELPDGSPGAVSDAGTSLKRVSGGFDRAGTTVAQASATVPAWEGRARVSFDGRIASYGIVMVAVRQALSSARSAVRKYETALEEARAKLRRLRDQEEMAVARLKRAEEQLTEAQGRLADAQQRMSAVSFTPLSSDPFSMGDQVAAQRDADAAQADIDAAQRQIDRERDEIRELREDARRVRRELVQAEEDAAGEVRAAAADLPDVQMPGGASSPSAYAGTVFAGPLSPFARDPRWGSAMAKAAADDEPEEPGIFEKAWNHAMENFGAGTPLEGPLSLADHVSPGFREDFGRALTEDLATGLYETGKMGVQLSVGYSLIDPAGTESAARKLEAMGNYAYTDPWGFTKDVTGITDIEQGHPGTAFGNWTLAAIPGGAGVKVVTTTGKVMPDHLPPLDQRADLTTPEGARDVMHELTSDANRALGENIESARDTGLLSRAEYAAGQNHERVAPMSYGKAVEREVARSIRVSPVLSESLVHLGGPSQPDFTITLPDGRVVNFDITTNDPRGIARHLRRPYGPGLEIIGYDRPDGVVPFPPDPAPPGP